MENPVAPFSHRSLTGATKKFALFGGRGNRSFASVATNLGKNRHLGECSVAFLRGRAFRELLSNYVKKYRFVISNGPFLNSFNRSMVSYKLL